MPNLLSYPASLGKDVAQGQHYLLIDSYESSSAVDREGQGKRMSSIALYIPPSSMSTTIAQNYEQLKGGARLAAMGSSEGAGASDVLIDSLTSAITKPQIVDNFRAAGFGLARNAHMALTYRGPSAFRQHPFTFDFWPKSKEEAKTVDDIIKDFRLGSTPRMGATMGAVNKLTAPYFHAPRQWQIKFCKGGMSRARNAAATTGIEIEGDRESWNNATGENPYIFQIQRSVIDSITINHDPDGVVGFHEDGSPVHTKLTVSFQEIQYVTNEVDNISDAHKNNVAAMNLQEKRDAPVTGTTRPGG